MNLFCISVENVIENIKNIDNDLNLDIYAHEIGKKTLYRWVDNIEIKTNVPFIQISCSVSEAYTALIIFLIDLDQNRENITEILINDKIFKSLSLNEYIDVLKNNNHLVIKYKFENNNLAYNASNNLFYKIDNTKSTNECIDLAFNKIIFLDN